MEAEDSRTCRVSRCSCILHGLDSRRACHSTGSGWFSILSVESSVGRGKCIRPNTEGQ